MAALGDHLEMDEMAKADSNDLWRRLREEYDPGKGAIGRIERRNDTPFPIPLLQWKANRRIAGMTRASETSGGDGATVRELDDVVFA